MGPECPLCRGWVGAGWVVATALWGLGGLCFTGGRRGQDLGPCMAALGCSRCPCQEQVTSGMAVTNEGEFRSERLLLSRRFCFRGRQFKKKKKKVPLVVAGNCTSTMLCLRHGETGMHGIHRAPAAPSPLSSGCVVLGGRRATLSAGQEPRAASPISRAENRS